jgi:hypothetical protein
MPIVIPPVLTQDEILEFLRKLDFALEGMDRHLERIRMTLQSLIDELIK